MAGSHLNAIMEQLAAIELGISITDPAPASIAFAYSYPPADPSSAACPFFVNFPLPGPAEFFAAGGQHIETNILSTLCVAREEAGDQAQLIKLVLYWRDAVLSAMAQAIALHSILPYGVLARIKRVSPLVRVEIGTAVFLGTEFELSVQELYPQTPGL